MYPRVITAEYLQSHPEVVFVFGDNFQRRGKKGAAILRSEPNAYGFVTKKAPNNNDESFFRPADYIGVFWLEMAKLIKEVGDHPEKTYLVSKLGAGLANRYHIYEKVIQPVLVSLRNQYPNVVLLN